MSETPEQVARRSGRHSWLEHPVLAHRYLPRGLLDGLRWEAWVTARLGEPPARSMELQCATGARSLFLFEHGLSRSLDGVDSRAELIEQGERSRDDCHAPGRFRLLDVQTETLPEARYDLVFACHALQDMVALEHTLAQAHRALTPHGYFVFEGYAGPSRFQWTDEQQRLVQSLAGLLPDHLAQFRWNARKTAEGRPDRAAVAASSPFGAIRSEEIAPLIDRQFEVVAARRLGGTLQNLLYNGIIHNFADDEPEALRILNAVADLEDTLIDARHLPSDFQLIIGRRRP